MLFSLLPMAAFAASNTVPQESYRISNNSFMTRLRWNYDEQAEFQLGFDVHWDNETHFTNQMGEALLASGKIQINNGKERTFLEAGLQFANGRTKSSFSSVNKEFIKEFYETDHFTITVTTPEGYTVKAENVPNQLDAKQKAAFKEALGGESTGPKYTINPGETYLKKTWGSATLAIDINELKNSAEKTEFCKNAQVKINGQDFGTMESMGFLVGYLRDFELSELSVIKSVIMEDDLNVELTVGGSTVKFTVKNELTTEERQQIAGNPDPKPEPEPETETGKATIGNCKVMLVKADDHGTESMSGPTMKKDAQMLINEKGETVLVLHFEPANIMGILAYATDLKLDGCTTEFVLKDDNSGVCIAAIPAMTADEQILPGSIHSSVMNAGVALKVTKPAETSNLSAALKQKVTETEAMLSKDNFYEETKKPVEDALAAAKAPADVVKAYTDLVKTTAGLRKIMENPFVGDTLFHVQALDTSIIGKKALAKYVKIEIVDGKKILTAHYNSYLDWDGFIYMDSAKVLDQNGKEIPCKYVLDENKNGTLTFEMPYVPASGIFDVVLGNGNEKEGSKDKLVTTKLQMNYATMVKGPFKILLEDAVNQYGYYTDSDWQTRLPLENRKDSYTEGSWAKFAAVLEQCKKDLQSGALTQQHIEESVDGLRDARQNLVYKIHAGSGSTANVGISAINNPEAPYYPSDAYAEYPEIVGWGGSRVVFGKDGAVYRVLDNGLDRDGKKAAGTGKLLLMAESLRVQNPFTKDEADITTRWQDSLLRKHMNGEFYENNFSAVEKSAILKSSIETYDYLDSGFGLPSKNYDTLVKTEDFIFAPNMAMLNSEMYGFGSNDSRITPTNYALRDVLEDALGDYVVMGVSPKGRLQGTFELSSGNLKAPPCMYLDAGKILMTVDAATGIPQGVIGTKPLETNFWKLVMHDDSLKLNDSYVAKVSGNTVSVDVGQNKEQLMAVVIEGDDFAAGTVKAYGKVDAKGFKLPSFDTATEKLYIMALRDEDGKTAYASQPALVKVDQNIAPETPDPEKPEITKGTGTVTVTMNKDGQLETSMCDVMFAEKAEVTVDGENATIKLYVAYPIPNFADQGKDGTLKNFVVSYNGKDYTAVSDTETKPLMTVKKDHPAFGLIKGDRISAQVLTIELPRAALDEAYLDAKAYVNVFMHQDVQFDMALSDLVLSQTKPETPETPENPEKPDVTELVLVDEATGIKIHAGKGVFTEDVVLVVSPITSGSDYQGAAKLLEDVGQKFKVYEIHFENKAGQVVQPNGVVTVSYKIPQGYDAAKIALYRVNADGSKTLLKGAAEDGYYTVEQKSFGIHALVETGSKTPETQQPAKPGVPQTGDSAPVLALVTLVLVSAAAVAALVVGKKRRTAK